MEQIKDIIPEVIKGMYVKHPQLSTAIDQAWQKVNETKVLTHTAISGFQNGQLIVNVDSPAWLFQLKLKTKVIENKLKREIPEISTVRFRIGKTR